MRPGSYRKGANTRRRNVSVYFQEYRMPKPRRKRGWKHWPGYPQFYGAGWMFKRMPGGRKI